MVTPSEEVERHTGTIVAAWAGGVDGLEVIVPFLEQLPSRLSPNGIAYLLIEKQNDTPKFKEVIESLHLTASTILRSKRRNEELAILRLCIT